MRVKVWKEKLDARRRKRRAKKSNTRKHYAKMRATYLIVNVVSQTAIPVTLNNSFSSFLSGALDLLDLGPPPLPFGASPKEMRM